MYKYLLPAGINDDIHQAIKLRYIDEDFNNYIEKVVGLVRDTKVYANDIELVHRYSLDNSIVTMNKIFADNLINTMITTGPEEPLRLLANGTLAYSFGIFAYHIRECYPDKLWEEEYDDYLINSIGSELMMEMDKIVKESPESVFNFIMKLYNEVILKIKKETKDWMKTEITQTGLTTRIIALSRSPLF